MKAISQLERLGYTFAFDGDAIHYTHNGQWPDPERVRPLLEYLRQNRDEAVHFLLGRASHEAHDLTDFEAEAKALLASCDGSTEWAQQWAELAERAGWPCWGMSWREWAADVAGTYPLTLRFPSDAKVATIEGQWRRLPSGEIETTFQTRKELAWSLAAVGLDRPEVLRALM